MTTTIKPASHIAIDFGGGSGRVMAGTYQADGSIELREIHRFANRPARLGNHLYWDFPALFEEMTEGLRKAVAEGLRIASVGIDSWGVDFGLVSANGALIGLPYCYRDESTAEHLEKFFETTSVTEHYAAAGIQIMAINSLYRLLAIKNANPALLQAADHLLFIPDLFSYYLCGEANNEYTIASTSELIDARTRGWNYRLIDRMDFPRKLFGPIVMPGTIRGYITERVRRRIGLEESDPAVPVVAVGSHDTACALHASEATTCQRTAFLSSGTWSLLGALIDEPILTEEARCGGFTNEGANGGKIKFLQNITGLWILQRLMDQWSKEGRGTDYPTLIAEARQSSIESLIDVDDPMFTNPVSMSEAIEIYCREHGQQPPATRGETALLVMRSLADRYRRGIEQLNALLPEPVTRLNIIGGGSRNELLNELTAEATGLEVIAGPVEATAIGNIMIQHEALS